MKDMIGREIKINDKIFYFRPDKCSSMFDTGEVIKINAGSIRVEFMGDNPIKGKSKNQLSNIFNTEGKVFILKNSEVEERKLLRECKRLSEERQVLEERVGLLETELNQVFSRFDILDL